MVDGVCNRHLNIGFRFESNLLIGLYLMVHSHCGVLISTLSQQRIEEILETLGTEEIGD